VTDDLGTSSDLVWVFVIFLDRESTTGSGFPFILAFIIKRSGEYGDLVSNKISGIKSDTELTDHRDIST
jgi:hypothetical protein